MRNKHATVKLLRSLLTTVALAATANRVATAFDDPAAPVAHLTDNSGSDLTAFKLNCPKCDPFKSELFLGETCEPEFNSLQVDPTSSGSSYSEMGTFSLEPGEYAEITTIDPAGTAKSWWVATILVILSVCFTC